MSDPIALWSDNQGDSFSDERESESDVEYRALPVEDFERMAADARAYRRVLDVIADPRLRDAPIAKTLADLGLDEPAGPPVKVMFFQSGWAHPVPASGGVTL